MIYIKFGGLSFQLQPDETFQDGKIFAEKFHEIPINDTWNNEIIRVQSIFMPKYSAKFYMRETEYLNFQNIKYSPDITIQFENKVYKSKNTYIELSSTIIVNELREVTLIFADIEQIRYENTILNTTVDSVLTYVYNTTSTNWNLYLKGLENIDLAQSEVSRFKNKISDYKKITKTINLRLFLSYIQLEQLLTHIGNVAPTKGYLTYKFINYTQLEETHKLIGKDLYSVDIMLFATNPTIIKQW